VNNLSNEENLFYSRIKPVEKLPFIEKSGSFGMFFIQMPVGAIVN